MDEDKIYQSTKGRPAQPRNMRVSTTIKKEIYEDIKQSGWTLSEALQIGWHLIKFFYNIQYEILDIKTKLNKHEKDITLIKKEIYNINKELKK